MKIPFNLSFKTKRNIVEFSKANVVPKELEPFLLDLNAIYAQTDLSCLSGREKEIDALYNCFLKSKNANAVLLGEHGAGKTVVLQKIVTEVIEKKAPQELADYHFLYLDINHILTKISNKIVQKKLAAIIEFVRKYVNLVLVIDQVHLVLTNQLLNYYFGLLVSLPQVKILGLSTEEDFYEFFQYDLNSLSRLDIINVLEPEIDDLYPMVEKSIINLIKYHKVKISKDLVKYAISVSTIFENSMNISNPGLIMQVIEKSMIKAKRRNDLKVSKKDIDGSFNFNYDIYNKMSREDKEQTAYHEAGHYLATRCAKYIKDIRPTALTIVPAEDFLGLTSWVRKPEIVGIMDENYFVDYIAIYLAGRIGEKIYFNSDTINTYGASQDLICATDVARSIITQYGMSSDFGLDMSYLGIGDLNHLNLINDRMKEAIDSATKKLIQKGKERAKQYLEEYKDLHKALVDALLEHGTLGEEQLNAICSKFF